MAKRKAVPEMGDLVTLPLDEITPYWRNPRRITPEAIDAVAQSIERYGYQQPIVVDKDHVVIVGHTRLAALKKLGFKEIPVHVANLSEAKVREYRLIDNKTQEMGAWDHNALVLELREFEKDLLDAYFPNIDLEITAMRETAMTQKDIEWGEDAAKAIPAIKPMATVKVVCPSCFHTFEVKADALPGVTEDDLQQMLAE